MSRRALSLAVRNALRSGLGYKNCDCDVTPGGRPPPRAGLIFVGVSGGARQGLSETCLEQDYSVTVTVTCRPKQPFDRIGTDELDKLTTGVNDRVDQIIAYMTTNQDVIRNAANALVPGYPSGHNGFVENLYYRSDTEADAVSGDWFHAEPDAECGLVARIEFGGAKRIQLIEGAG